MYKLLIAACLVGMYHAQEICIPDRLGCSCVAAHDRLEGNRLVNEDTNIWCPGRMGPRGSFGLQNRYNRTVYCSYDWEWEDGLFEIEIRCDGQPEVESQNSRYVNYAKASGLCRAKRLVWDRRDGEWNFHAISNSYHDNRGRQDDYVGAGGDTCFIIDPDK